MVYANDIKTLQENWSIVLERDMHMIKNPGIGSGLCGLALFWRLAYTVSASSHSRDMFFRCFEAALDCIEDTNTYRSLWVADITELAYFTFSSREILQQEYDLEQLQEQLNTLLLSNAQLMIGSNLLDPFVGAFYPAYYFKKVQAPPDFIIPFVDLLIKQSGEMQDGLFFDSAFRKNQKCLSLSHGLAFYIIWLCGLGPNYINKLDNYRLVKGYVSFLMKNRNDFSALGCFFPDYVGESDPTRLCLCYGDAGILYALVVAADWLVDENLRINALDMLKTTSKRKGASQTRIVDSSLLYGEAGMMLYYRSLQDNMQITGFEAECVYWQQHLRQSLKRVNWDYFLSGDYLQKEGIYPLTFNEGFTGVIASLIMMNNGFKSDVLFPFYMA